MKKQHDGSGLQQEISELQQARRGEQRDVTGSQDEISELQHDVMGLQHKAAAGGATAAGYR